MIEFILVRSHLTSNWFCPSLTTTWWLSHMGTLNIRTLSLESRYRQLKGWREKKMNGPLEKSCRSIFCLTDTYFRSFPFPKAMSQSVSHHLFFSFFFFPPCIIFIHRRVTGSLVKQTVAWTRRDNVGVWIELIVAFFFLVCKQ